MALDEMFSDSVQAAVQNRAQMAPIAGGPEPGFSLWGTVKAPFTGLAAGALESGAFWSDMVGAFGTTNAAYGTTGVMPFAETDAQREWRESGADAARKRLAEDDAFSSETGDTLRGAVRWMGPTPETAGYAEQTVFNLARVVTKAVGYSVGAGGPAAGALLTGIDEGVTTSDELRRQGVDLATRAQVGAVTGVATGVGVALPVAGAGIKSTAALVAAGGPGMFVAQNAISREILENANYEHLASNYDPFDPVGLTVSTLLPAAFGGWALRARRGGTGPARGEGPPETAEAPRGGMPDSEMADAARVNQVRELVDSWNLGRPEDVRAANDAMLSVMRASDQLADGVPVSVLDRIPMSQVYAARAVERMLTRAEASRAELLPQAEAVAGPGVVASMRAELEALTAVRPNAADGASVQAMAATIRAADPRMPARRALEQARRDLDQQAQDYDARVARLEEQIDANAAAVDAQRALRILDEQINQMRAERAAIDAPATDFTPGAAAVRQVVDQVEPAPRARPADQATPRASETAPMVGPVALEPARVTPAPMAAVADPIAAPAKLPTSLATDAADAALAARVADLEATRGDLPVRLEGMDEDIPLSEALRRIQDDAKLAESESNLLTVAAQCAIGAI